MHLRETIRNYFQALLISGNVANKNVLNSSVYPAKTENKETVIIFTKSEVSEIATIGEPGSSVRELTLLIEIFVKDVAGLASLLDDITAQIETIIGTDCNPIPEITGIQYAGFETEYNGNGDNIFLVGTMEYLITYWLVNDKPEQPGA